LGMSLGGVDTLFTQGSLEDTGKPTDLAIQGDGFFVVDNGQGGFLYTRDGNLDVGVDGSLLNLTTGMKVMGWTADPVTGAVDTTGQLETLLIPFGQNMARATDEIVLRGNLDAEATAPVTATVALYDSLGGYHSIDVTFTKGAGNNWTWTATKTNAADTGMGNPTVAGGTISFGSDGSYSSTNPATSISVPFSNGASSPATIALDLSAMTQLAASASNVTMSSQTGLPPGALTTFNVTSTGEVIGIFSNGINRTLGQIAMAKFINPGGLMKAAQGMFAPSPNSGTAQVGLPNVDGRGFISAGYLEMSNVELAQQFTNMIIAERGFQANSRVITASDEMLQELVNLKR
jgi:flagellar hook protein FlgE